MITQRIGPGHVVLIVMTLSIGLAADVRTDIVGQSVIAVFIWLLFYFLVLRLPRETRYPLMACLTIATAGELVLSLGWGLYTYRLGNIPLFVPPGHVLLLLLGLALAQRISERAARGVAIGALAYAAIAALTGLDTFAILLALVIAAAWFALPSHRTLYASTMLVSLLLELYGTWLGNWFWAREVPGIALVTTNPPGTVGAFYCALDALVVLATLAIFPKVGARAERAQTAKAA